MTPSVTNLPGGPGALQKRDPSSKRLQMACDISLEKGLKTERNARGAIMFRVFVRTLLFRSKAIPTRGQTCTLASKGQDLELSDVTAVSAAVVTVTQSWGRRPENTQIQIGGCLSGRNSLNVHVESRHRGLWPP